SSRPRCSRSVPAKRTSAKCRRFRSEAGTGDSRLGTRIPSPAARAQRARLIAEVSPRHRNHAPGSRGPGPGARIASPDARVPAPQPRVPTQMTFFERQAAARRSTRRLIVLFALAVLGIVAAIDLVVLVVLGSQMPGVAVGGDAGSLLAAATPLLAVTSLA